MTVAPLDPRRARLTSGYGWRFNPTEFHAGIDLAAAIGEPVRAVRQGRVVVSAPSGALDRYGNVVVIEHPSGEASLYAHLDSRAVNRGDYVAENQPIGTVGTTAGTRTDPGKHFERSGAHLHLEILTRWPPKGRKLDRIDPTRLWPPAIAGRQPAHPERQQTAPDAPQARQGGAAWAMLALLAALAMSRR